MTIFNLLTFPNVCRACLQPLHPDQMVALETHSALFGADIGSFLKSLTFLVPERIVPYLPSTVCFACLEVMEFFFKYRRKMVHLQEFLVALVSVKLGDETQLKELFETQTEQLDMLFRDLDLCNTSDARAEDLLAEYDQYMIASMPFEENNVLINENIVEPPEITLCEEWNATEDIGKEESNVAIIQLLPEEVFCEDEASERRPEVIGCEGGINPSAAVSKRKRKRSTMAKLKIKIASKVERRSIQPDEDEPKDDSSGSEGAEEDVPPSSVDHKSTQSALRDDTVKRLRCQMCSYQSYYTVAFELHCKKHQANEGKTGHLCSHPYCLKLFSTNEELRNHRENNTLHRYICEICGTELKHRRSFDVHLERHAGITHFQCSYCSSSFFTVSETNAHVEAMHFSEDRAECQVCGALFTSKKLLSQHLDSHNLERNHHCTECPISFKSQHHLLRHIKTVHQVVRFSCEHCNVSYGRRDKLRHHMEKVHQVQAYFVCDICARSFDKDEALREHLSRHANPKNLECGTCLMVCRSPESFEKHTCITYQDDYVCCGRDFKNHMLYNRHMLSHGIKINARVRLERNEVAAHARAPRKSQPARRDSKKTSCEPTSLPRSCFSCGHRLLTKEAEQQHVCEMLFLDDNGSESSEMVEELDMQ